MGLRIEMLGVAHRRDDFDCDEPALNEFLSRLAGQQQRRGFGKTYVALPEDGVSVIGFVTLSAGQVATAQLPSTLKLPRYPLPVLRIGRLAVDKRYQGQGVGSHLLRFALNLASEWSQSVGLYGVAVEAKHDQVRAFYLGLGFLSGVDDPLHMILPLSSLARAMPDHGTRR
jgi:GNAT superfamily N-acetyltransferase